MIGCCPTSSALFEFKIAENASLRDDLSTHTPVPQYLDIVGMSGSYKDALSVEIGLTSLAWVVVKRHISLWSK